MQTKLAEILSTVFYIGKIKYAPGTFGSMPAFPLCYIILYFVLNNKIVFPFTGFSFEEQQIIALFSIELICCILIFAFGTYATSIYIIDKTEQDPKEVVVDELVGQMLTIILSSFSVIFLSSSSLINRISSAQADFLCLVIMPFVLFRFFDIVKPWPINWMDQNIKGSMGIMLDDIAAAIFATVVQYVIIFFIIDWFPLV
jgi:phosphatidylglycerophosphatase A